MKESLPPAPKKHDKEVSNENEPTSNPWRRRISYLFALGILLLFFLPNILNNGGPQDIPFQEFRTMVITNQVSEAEFNNNTGKIIKACVPMHAFGHPCRIDDIKDICDKYKI